MSSDKEKPKAEIMAQVEKLVDQMLNAAPEANIHINDIERLAVGSWWSRKQARSGSNEHTINQWC